jgi:hypothetical protein
MTDKTTAKAGDKAKKKSSGDDSKSTDAKAMKSSDSKESSTDSDPGDNYSVGERQKPVSKAYRDGWDRVFSKRQRKRSRA